MSNLFKKISALVLTAIMVLTMCSSVFADGVTVTYPTANDKATITATNIEAGSEVTAYRVVEPVYVEGIGFEKYQTVSGVGIVDPVKPTAAEITKVAAGISDGTIIGLEKVSLEATAESATTYTAKAGAGYWVVLVTKTPTASKIYNPMLAGVYYSNGGSNTTMENGTVNAKDKWTLNGSTAYDKSAAVSVSKKIANTTAKLTDTTTTSEKGDDLAIGDYAKFEINGTIPAYTDAYTQVTYKITDTTSDGLTLVENDDYPVTVIVGGKTVDASDNTYTLNVKNRTMVVDFASAYALAHTGQAVKVTYFAQLNEKAKTNFAPNTNTVKVTYSNNPTIDKDTKKTPTTDTPEDKTYHYTFEIDGNLYGTTTTTGNKVTTELTKTGTKEETTKYTKTENNPLKDAEFTLYKEDGTTVVQTASSDEHGQLNFKGLDAGKYKLKETKAPSPYSLNSAVIPVEITAYYNNDGTLNDYSINIGGNSGKTFTYTATYSETLPTQIVSKVGGEEEAVSDNAEDKSTYEIKNTPAPNLPSTGCMGTYIFTIIGVVLMACAAGAFMISRRKSEN